MLNDEFLCDRGKKRSQTFAKVLTNSYNGKGGGKECRDVEKIDKKGGGRKKRSGREKRGKE